MKILKKRAFACAIDSFILGSIIATIQLVIPNLLIGKSDIFNLLIIFPFFCRDFTFKGASIGKKMLGIRVYDKNWKSPSFSSLLKRSILTYTIGFLIFCKARFIDGSIIDLIDWERDKIGTRVVDNKVFAKLSEEAKQLDGDYAENMSKLYDEYVRTLYLK